MRDHIAETIDLQRKKLLKATCAGCSKSLTGSSLTEKCPNCGGLLFNESQALQPGAQIAGTYEIVSQLGVGAWGVVYRAWHEALKREVAIKVLHQHLVEKSKKLERFSREIRSLNELSHEAFSAVYDTGVMEDTKQPYIVQELVEGRSLRQLLDAGESLTGAQFKRVFSSVLEALAQAHSKGIIHRDIKPSNIMLSGEGDAMSAKLLDFGIAKLVDHDGAPALTSTGDLLGTPLYMSPEQCVGDHVDYRSDLYAIGCVMHEALSRKPPFEAENSFQCMMKQMHELPPDLLALGVSAQYHAVIMRSLQKKADDRYADAMEFSRAVLELPDDWHCAQQPRPRAFSAPTLRRLAIAAAAASVLAVPFLLRIGMQTPRISDPAHTASVEQKMPDDLMDPQAGPSHEQLVSMLKEPLPHAPVANLCRVFALSGSYNGNGELLAEPVNLSGTHLLDVIFNESNAKCFALNDKFRFCQIDPASGGVTEIPLPNGLAPQAAGIAFDTTGNYVYVLSNQLSRYNIAQKTWEKLGDFPVGGAGFACSFTGDGFFEFSRTNEPTGLMRNLYKLDARGKIVRKIPLSRTLLTADGNERMVQLRTFGDLLVAVIPQPAGAPKPWLIAVINTDSGEVMNMQFFRTEKPSPH